VDANGATALHRGVRTRCAAAAETLLDHGADATARNKSGSTSFHLAVQSTGRGGSGSDAALAEQRQLIELFLARGLSPSLRSDCGKSVVESAKAPWVRELLGSAR
jgi:hypothetical protein